MVRRWVQQSVVGLACLGMAACNVNSSAPPGGNKTTAEKPAPLDPGAALYKATPAPKLDAITVAEDAIVVPNAVVRLNETQTVPSQLDAYVVVIGTPLPDGAAFDRNDRNIVVVRDTNKERAFRRLQEGDRVVKEQIVSLFDDLEIMVQIDSNQKIIKESESAIVEARNGSKFIEEQLVLLEGGGQSIAKSEKLQLQATLARYRENVFTSMREKVKAEGDERRGWTLWDKHRAKSKVTGVITKILRRAGEFAKAGEPIMEILSTEEQIVEGNLDAKDAGSVTPGMRVVVEPTMPTGPDTKYGNTSHRLEVTGIAVTSHPGRPLVISSSLDTTVGVWDVMPPEGKPRTQFRLPHPVGVRSVTASPAMGAKHFVATGCDDGRVRLWDVSNPEKIADKPAKEFDEAHASAVTCLAFSPDGKYLATASGRDVWVWNVAEGKKMYALPGEHKDAVTAVRFTPQATLVTVARDKTVRVWAVGDKGGNVARTIDHRKGNVDALAVSKDGSRILFDQDDGRIDLVSLADGRAVGSVQNATTASRFAGFAIFGSDDSLILTAAADGEAKGELQLWNAPSIGGRASERRRLVTPYRATPTAAAFSPDGDKKFIAIGTQAGGVYIWAKATSETQKEQIGTVTSLLRLDAKTVKVQVKTSGLAGDVGNLLMDKGAATIIIRPGEAAVPAPKAMAPAPASGIVQASGAAPVGPVVPGIMVAPVVNIPAPGSLMPNVAVPSASLTAPTVQPNK